MKIPRIFKLKATQINPVPVQDTYEGMDTLKITKDTICLVTEKSVANKGDIIIRTDSMQNPFMTLQSPGNYSYNHQMWGTSLEGYVMQIMPFAKREDYERV